MLRSRSILMVLALAAGLGTARAQGDAAANPPDLDRLVTAVECLVNVLAQDAQDRSLHPCRWSRAQVLQVMRWPTWGGWAMI